MVGHGDAKVRPNPARAARIATASRPRRRGPVSKEYGKNAVALIIQSALWRFIARKRAAAAHIDASVCGGGRAARGGWAGFGRGAAGRLPLRHGR